MRLERHPSASEYVFRARVVVVDVLDLEDHQGKKLAIELLRTSLVAGDLSVVDGDQEVDHLEARRQAGRSGSHAFEDVKPAVASEHTDPVAKLLPPCRETIRTSLSFTYSTFGVESASRRTNSGPSATPRYSGASWIITGI